MIIAFDTSIDVIDLITPIHYYVTNKGCVISKVLLISQKKNTDWYNDITPYVSSNLLVLYARIKGTLLDDTRLESTHITEEHIAVGAILEIHTLNLVNEPPKLISRKAMLDAIYKDWLKQL